MSRTLELQKLSLPGKHYFSSRPAEVLAALALQRMFELQRSRLSVLLTEPRDLVLYSAPGRLLVPAWLR